MSDSNTKNDDLWNEIPSSVFVGLGQRGREKVNIEECFVPGCKNTNREDLEPYEKTVYSSPKDQHGNYYDCTKIKTKCKKCGKSFQYAMKVVNITAKQGEKEETSPFVGMMYILDENGKNIGFLGYY